jgi:hypothetical protein
MKKTAFAAALLASSIAFAHPAFVLKQYGGVHRLHSLLTERPQA